MGVSLVSLFCLLFTQPEFNLCVQGAVPKGNATKEYMESLQLKPGEVIYKCPKCCCIKPERAHHCRYSLCSQLSSARVQHPGSIWSPVGVCRWCRLQVPSLLQETSAQQPEDDMVSACFLAWLPWLARKFCSWKNRPLYGCCPSCMAD